MSTDKYFVYFREQVKVKQFYAGLDIPQKFQGFEVHRFQDNRHVNVARLSALPTDSIYPPFLLKADYNPGP